MYQQPKIGVAGGGQLGRMLLQAGADLNIHFSVLDPDADAPCKDMAPFTQGSPTDYETLLNFGRNCDIVTIEIEHVNVKALYQLEAEGKKVFPQPRVIELIQNKQKQKQFYKENNIPTAPFFLTSNREEIKKHLDFFPCIHKSATGGYDGRGVRLLKGVSDVSQAFDGEAVLEKWIDFEKELAVIAARNEDGQVRTFPAAEMVFHPRANLAEYLFAPAEISENTAQEAKRLAENIIQKLNMVGVLAVEMFLTKDKKILVNEVAPRPHNSGHHTIEANSVSQYQQHLRAILNLPLGDTSIISPAAMINLLGDEKADGTARYQGLEKALAIPNVYVHLYGKKTVKPFRKMGHLTVLDKNVSTLKSKIKEIQSLLKITA